MKNTISKSYLKLISSAKQAMKYSYSPYSKFRVGAAVLASDGKVFTGANIENASYSLTLCAERVALSSAVASGRKKIKAVAVASSSKKGCPPCGACLQFIAEFGADTDIVFAGKDGKYVVRKVRELLPEAFILTGR